MLPVISNELAKAFMSDSMSSMESLVTGAAVIGCFREGLGCQGTASSSGGVWVGSGKSVCVGGVNEMYFHGWYSMESFVVENASFGTVISKMLAFCRLHKMVA